MKKANTLIAIFIIFLLTAASAHEWYDPACCSGNDCHPIACELITEKGKSLFYKGHEFYSTMIKPSQDSQRHVCIANELKESPHPYCIYVQQGS